VTGENRITEEEKSLSATLCPPQIPPVLASKRLVGKRFVTEAFVKQLSPPVNERLTTTETMMSRRDKCLNVRGGYAVVWCVSSATQVLCTHQRQHKVLGIRLYVARAVQVPTIDIKI
jgi:hypothetical protein